MLGGARTEGAILSTTPRRGWYLPLKAVIEWTAALFLVPLTLPVVAGIAAAVRLTSSGPAIYSQPRVGRHGRVFLMHKIRTMRHDCEAETGPVWPSTNDSRVTGIGRFLRCTHLDELPQLLNVLQGHMSLIGPRPERPELCAIIEQTLPRFPERLYLRPGMTGLAQMRLPPNGGIHTVPRKLAYDLYYVREVSPWLDLCLALSTVPYLVTVTCHALGGRPVRDLRVCLRREEGDHPPGLGRSTDA